MRRIGRGYGCLRRTECDGYLGSCCAAPTRLKAIAEKAAAEGVEFQFGEDRPQGRLVARADAKFLRLERQRDVDVDRGEPLGEERLVTEFLQ